MDELLARHRKEARDLQARITQKKKGASKKTRKGVNDECEQLERELKDRHAAEIAQLSGGPAAVDEEVDTEDEELESDGLNNGVAKLTVAGTQQAQQESTPSAKKPSRQKARLARRAAEQAEAISAAEAEATDMPDLKAMELERMRSSFARHKLAEKEIRADGHCLYSAIADQLNNVGLGLKPRLRGGAAGDGAQTEERNDEVPPYKIVRAAAADYIEEHEDEFEPFLEEPLFTYVHKVRDTGTWGGQLELLALAKTYGVDISVVQGDGPMTEIEGGDGGSGEERKKLWLAYYRHNFGLGEHYNSLRKVT